MKRRILGLVLCLVLSLSLLPFSVFAADVPIERIMIADINTADIADFTTHFECTPEGSATVQKECWEDINEAGKVISSDGGDKTPELGHTYHYSITLQAEDGYVFTEETAVNYQYHVYALSVFTHTLSDDGKTLVLEDFFLDIEYCKGVIDEMALDFTEMGYVPLRGTGKATAVLNTLEAACVSGQIDADLTQGIYDLDKDGYFDLFIEIGTDRNAMWGTLSVHPAFSLSEDYTLTLNKDALDYIKNNLEGPYAKTINFQFRGEEIPYTLDLSGGPVTLSDKDVILGLVNVLTACIETGDIYSEYKGPNDYDADFDLDKDGSNDISQRVVSEDSMQFTLLETASIGDSIDLDIPLLAELACRANEKPFYTTVTVNTKASEPPTPPEPPKTNPFVDIKEGDPCYHAVLWAYYAEPQVTNGMDDTHFGPNLTVTRGQCVAFLWRAMGEPEPTSTTNPFVDVPESQYYYKPVLWAVEKGITKGVDATHFNPDDTLSTQHIITFLYRTANPGKDGWDGPAAAWAGAFDPSDHYYPFGVNIAVNNTTPCPRANVVQFLYVFANA